MSVTSATMVMRVSATEAEGELEEIPDGLDDPEGQVLVIRPPLGMT